jgi:hypothetical protein
VRAESQATATDPEALGKAVALALLDNGAGELLQQLA